LVPSTALDVQRFIELFTVTAGEKHYHAIMIIYQYIFISWFINLHQ
jgi:hypothetical protein